MKKFLFFLVFVSFMSCQDDCESERIDDQTFEAESLDYQSWLGKEEFVYKDLNGNEEVYLKETCSTIIAENDRFFLDCDEEEFIVFKSELTLCRFENAERDALAYAHNIELFNENESDPEKLVDVLNLSFIGASSVPGSTTNQTSYLTHAKNSNEDIVFRNMVNFTLQDSVEIGDKTFYDVFVQRNNLEGLMFTKTEGIVSFHDSAGTQFYLDSCR